MRVASLWVALLFALLPLSAAAQPVMPAPDVTLDDLARAVVAVSAEIPPEGRTAGTLGTHREGSGVVIDASGHVVTIGYLVLEASEVKVTRFDGATYPARVLGYDAESGLGVLQVSGTMELEPLALGDSSALAVQDPVLVLNYEGTEAASTATVVSRRTFTGYWEYLLEQAIFTVPAQRNYAGAALVDRQLRLVGIGSLFVENAAAAELTLPGNVFVPIDKLKPVLRDLVESGRPRKSPRPWMGVNVAEQFGRVIVTRVNSGGPARESGLQPGDIILEIAGQKVQGIEHFYRQLWALGDAGVVVKLTVLQRNSIVPISVTTQDRYTHYRSPGGQ